MPEAPSVTPFLDNIYPLSEDPTHEQMRFIHSRFGTEAQEDFARLSRLSYFARNTEDERVKAALNNELYSLFEGEAKRISRPTGEISPTAVPSSQPETGQGAPTDASQTKEGASTEATGTAHQQ
jgi:hypothetical protein